MNEFRQDLNAPRPATPTVLLNSQYLTSSHDWRSAEGRAHSPFEVATFVRQAQQAEAAGFHAIFQADFSGVVRERLRDGPPLSAFEPFQLSALVASATSRIAVMPTVSTLYTHPFTFARNLASLDRIAGGRAWVNVVSSFRDGTAIGMKRDVPAGQRHLQTEEFLHVARRLWASWPPKANVLDVAGGRFVDGELIADVDHIGEFYEQHGPIDTAPYSSDFPFTLQATSSLEGLRLAARTADAVFAGTPTLAAARELRRILRREVRRAGRDEDSVALLPGAFIHVLDPGAGPATWTRRQPLARPSPTRRWRRSAPGSRPFGCTGCGHRTRCRRT
ncbi:LLM class flavin-dependent oxidoreductase [Nonomuraea antimicrobica]